jgi:hypothetical protein
LVILKVVLFLGQHQCPLGMHEEGYLYSISANADTLPVATVAGSWGNAHRVYQVLMKVKVDNLAVQVSKAHICGSVGRSVGDL